jgi:hypothetical protein
MVWLVLFYEVSSLVHAQNDSGSGKLTKVLPRSMEALLVVSLLRRSHIARGRTVTITIHIDTPSVNAETTALEKYTFVIVVIWSFCATLVQFLQNPF